MAHVRKVVILNTYELELNYDLLLKETDSLGLDREEVINQNYIVHDLMELFDSQSDIIRFLKPTSILEITLDNDNKCILTNIDLASIYSWVDHCEHIFASWYQSYVMFSMNSYSGQYGIIATWECNERKWIFHKEEPHVCCFYYSPLLDRFLGLITLREWVTIRLALFVIKPSGFVYKEIWLHHASSNDVAVNYLYLITDSSDIEILAVSDNQLIKNDDNIYFNDAKRLCYVSATGWKGKEYYFKIPYDDIINIKAKDT